MDELRKYFTYEGTSFEQPLSKLRDSVRLRNGFPIGQLRFCVEVFRVHLAGYWLCFSTLHSTESELVKSSVKGETYQVCRIFLDIPGADQEVSKRGAV